MHYRTTFLKTLVLERGVSIRSRCFRTMLPWGFGAAAMAQGGMVFAACICAISFDGVRCICQSLRIRGFAAAFLRYGGIAVHSWCDLYSRFRVLFLSVTLQIPSGCSCYVPSTLQGGINVSADITERIYAVFYLQCSAVYMCFFVCDISPCLSTVSSLFLPGSDYYINAS